MMKFLKVYYDWQEGTDTLSDAEFGRLIRALLDYAQTGNRPELQGAEKHIFPIVKLQVDRDRQSYEKNCENGSKGGRPKTETNPLEPKITHDNPTEPTITQRNQEQEQEQDQDITNSAASSAPPVISLVQNDGNLYGVSQPQINRWQELYPAVDVLAELRKMAGWLEANSRNRKTKGGMARFAANWLSRVQDKSRPVAPVPEDGRSEISVIRKRIEEERTGKLLRGDFS